MILHFSHIGLTDGRTFTLIHSRLRRTFRFGSSARLWRPVRSPLPRRRSARSVTRSRCEAQRGMVAGVLGRSSDARRSPASAAQAAARPAPTSCHGVSTRGPSAVIAIVNSKCAASEPSWEKIDQWSSADPDGVAPGGDHRLDRQHHPLLQLDAGAGLRRSWGSAGPRACRGRCRGRRASARPTGPRPRRAPGRRGRCRRGGCRPGTAGTATISDSSVTFSSFWATGLIGPTAKVRAASATQPSSTTPMSTDRMSPAAELVRPGDAVDDHRVRRGADRARESRGSP